MFIFIKRVRQCKKANMAKMLIINEFKIVNERVCNSRYTQVTAI